MRHAILLLSAALLLSATAIVPAQSNPAAYKIPDPGRLERATVTGADGRLEWADLEKLDKDQRERLRCPTCEGRKQQECPFCWRLEHIEECPECEHPPSAEEKPTTCRTCVGEGTLPDPLESAPCPGCSGAGVTRCHRCFGEGGYPPSAGSDLRERCPVCKGGGHFDCKTCAGKRCVEPPKLKPSLAEADLDDLQKALGALAAVEKQLPELVTTGDARKDAKLWAAVLKPGLRGFPPLQRLSKDFTEVTKTLAKGAQAVAYAEMVAASLTEKKASLEYYLKHQRRCLELCIARQEHNAKIDDGQ